MWTLHRMLDWLVPSGRRRAVDRRPENASPRYLAGARARAGDRAREAGDHARALELYGQAVDLYLESGHGRAAEVICERIVSTDPSVVRAHYTLSAIALGRGDVAGTAERLQRYVAAARSERALELAVPAIVRLAGATNDEALRACLAAALRAADRDELAVRVELGSAGPSDAGTSWSRAVAAALEKPDPSAKGSHG